MWRRVLPEVRERETTALVPPRDLARQPHSLKRLDYRIPASGRGIVSVNANFREGVEKLEDPRLGRPKLAPKSPQPNRINLSDAPVGHQVLADQFQQFAVSSLQSKGPPRAIEDFRAAIVAVASLSNSRGVPTLLKAKRRHVRPRTGSCPPRPVRHGRHIPPQHSIQPAKSRSTGHPSDHRRNPSRMTRLPRRVRINAR
jgi:hypothetical protein